FLEDLKRWMGDPSAAVGAATDASPIPAGDEPSGPARPKSATTNTWSRSQADATFPTNKTPILVATALGALVLLGGGSFMAYALLSGSGETPELESAAQPTATGTTVASAAEPKEPVPTVAPAASVAPEPPPSASAEAPPAEPEPEPEPEKQTSTAR